MPNAAFPPTQWSVLFALQGGLPEEAERGMVRLCESYWYPIYAFIRGTGHDRPAAEDLTQQFFTNLIARETFENIAPERGRFRSFLLAAVQHFLSNQRHRDRAKKRGGGVAPLSLDFAAADDRYRLEPRAAETPETLYEIRWARALLDDSLHRLHAECVKAGKAVQFQAFRPFLMDDDPPSYAGTAAHLKLTEGAAKVAVHRMRKRFGEILRARIGETVASLEEADEELRYVGELLKRR